MIAFPPRSLASRALAAALTVVIAGLMWAGVVVPIKARHDANVEAIADGARLLSSLTGFIAAAQKQGTENSLADLDRYRGDFLNGAEDSIIVADLQTRLGSLIVAGGVELTSARAMPVKSRDGLDYLGLRLQLRGEMARIQQIMHAIETATPFLFIERAVFRVDERFAAGRERSEESISPISLELDLHGAKWPAPAPAGRAGTAP